MTESEGMNEDLVRRLHQALDREFDLINRNAALVKQVQILEGENRQLKANQRLRKAPSKGNNENDN
jgi:hypothetical protein